MKKRLYLLFFFLFSQILTAQKFQNLALTPPMGWNSWNYFNCDIDEQTIREIADAMVETGMKDAGYEYIVIDDCWQVDRDENGYIMVDKEKFPSGIKALADYIHNKGLKFGIYSCAGFWTCQRRPGSKNYEKQDAEKYAEWSVDYVKYDWCYSGFLSAEKAYTRMSEAITEAGRPMVFSLCEWGQNRPWLWAKDVGHLWRTTRDILDCWDCRTFFDLGFTRILDKQVGLEKYAGVGHWNDPDMLQVGNGGMTFSEYRAHFSLWCMLAAPLMAGNDLRNMDADVLTLLTNPHAINIDQDKLGKQGYKIKDEGDFEIWVKPLENNEWAVCFFNRSLENWEVNIDWADIEIMGDYTIFDIWKDKNIGKTTSTFTNIVPPHDVVWVRLSF